MKEEEIKLDQSTVNLNETPVEEAKEEISTKETPIVEETKQEEAKEPTYNELRKMAKEKGLKFAKNASKEDLIKLLETADSINAGVISLDNKPVSPIVISNDKEEINAGFVASAPKHKAADVRGTYNGRIYKVIGNGYGIWCDNGQSFDLATLNK